MYARYRMSIITFAYCTIYLMCIDYNSIITVIAVTILIIMSTVNLHKFLYSIMLSRFSAINI